MTTTDQAVDLVGEATVGNLARAALFAAATSATAPVSVTHPLAPNIPITLQTLWVFLAGLFLGPLWAGVSFVLYLLAGVVGLPVFAGATGGVGHLFGGTGGYLFGFVFGAIATGLVAHGTSLESPRAIPLPRLVAAPVVGAVVVYAFGVVGLMLALGLGLVTAVTTGVLPFLPTAAIKVGASVLVARSDAVVPR
ncbi:biotin transporter BioY [Halomarina litorea]|uniref:biotin transporter BioY n=1 Tax=Halomarina litorea TaxID=2961595 RepID=UPI0020C383CC|nr:biotin transporter BioY [Halomarina sp. BCD28]